MTIFEKAVIFAVNAHSGMFRKGGTTPYIVHPLEVAAIAGYFTDDPEVLAADVLHDTVEDTPCTYEDLCREFGKRVADLVASDSEDKREELPPSATWKVRKQETLDALRTASREEKIIVFSDKLSNLRSLYRDYLTVWVAVWERFNQKDPAEHLWYYGSVLELCEELSDTAPYRVYSLSFIDLKARVLGGDNIANLKSTPAPLDERGGFAVYRFCGSVKRRWGRQLCRRTSLLLQIPA